MFVCNQILEHSPSNKKFFIPHFYCVRLSLNLIIFIFCFFFSSIISRSAHFMILKNRYCLINNINILTVSFFTCKYFNCISYRYMLIKYPVCICIYMYMHQLGLPSVAPFIFSNIISLLSYRCLLLYKLNHSLHTYHSYNYTFFFIVCVRFTTVTLDLMPSIYMHKPTDFHVYLFVSVWYF